MTPAEEVAATIGHYLRELTQLAGKRWTPANERNVARLAELLSALGGNVETQDTIPPFRAPEERRAVTTPTTPLRDDLADAAAVARMTRRNGHETRR